MMGPTIVNILWLYLVCHFSGLLTLQLSRFGDVVYQLNWYLLPLKLQIDLPIMLALAQKKVFLQAYGGIGCTLDVFHTVRNLSLKNQL